MELVSSSTLRSDIDTAFAHLRAQVATEVDQFLDYDRTAEAIAKRLSEQLPDRVSGRAGILRDGMLKALRASARQRMEGEPDEHINAFREAACHEALEAQVFEPSAFVVAATPESSSWQGIGVAAVVFVTGIAVTFLTTDTPEENGRLSLWRILGTGVSVALAAAAFLASRRRGPSGSRESLIEQVGAYLHSERPHVEAWLGEIKKAYETCASPFLPPSPSGAVDA